MADITSVADAKKAIENGQVSLEKINFFIKAFAEIKQEKEKEAAEFLPELEKNNFKIDSTGWEEIVSPNGIKVKENPEGDVWEYLEGVYIGEQLFKYSAAIREVDKAGKKLPESWEIYKDTLEKKYQSQYQSFFVGENILFCGWRNQITTTFDSIGKECDFWCKDASFFTGYGQTYHRTYGDRGFGCSVRCLKTS